jgi:hypothetical protein
VRSGRGGQVPGPSLRRPWPTKGSGGLVDEFHRHVDAIHPGLDWELGKGQVAQHVLVVTSAGNAELRSLAERWRLAGPEPDATFEYASARTADPSALESKLVLDGIELALADIRIGVTVDDDRQVLDLVVFHPRFPDLNESTRATVSYLMLDWLLGEDGVERWVGTINWTTEPPPAAVAPDALPEILAGLRARHPEPSWVILEGEGPGGPRILIVTRRPLKRVEHPLFDLHGTIELPFSQQTPDGLPAAPALDWLRAFEDQLLSAHGEDLLLVAAHETTRGRRTIHLYCDSQGRGPAAVEDFVTTCQWPGAQVNWVLDPGKAIAPYQ